MRLQTILNRVHRHPSFVYGKVRFVEDGGALDLYSGLKWAKKDDEGEWVFWNSQSEPSGWTPLPRKIKFYELSNHVLIESNGSYVSKSGKSKWPDALVDPAEVGFWSNIFGNIFGKSEAALAAELHAKTKASEADDFKAKTDPWLANIHSEWDDKFYLKRKGCTSGDDACCRWTLRLAVDWSTTSGDKKVYAVWANEWERSDAENWYLTEHRVGVAAHECGHLLGAYDEYIDSVDKKTGIRPPAAVASPPVIANASVMGSSLSGAHPRHLKELADEITKRLPQATGRGWTLEVKSK